MSWLDIARLGMVVAWGHVEDALKSASFGALRALGEQSRFPCELSGGTLHPSSDRIYQEVCTCLNALRCLGAKRSTHTWVLHNTSPVAHYAHVTKFYNMLKYQKSILSGHYLCILDLSTNFYVIWGFTACPTNAISDFHGTN